MSLKKINLRKLLTLMFAPAPQAISILRADIRDNIRKDLGVVGGGGDFHAPFWHDAKAHVNGERDLHFSVAARIGTHKGRARLYPFLRDGFLDWWDHKRRWTNEPSTSELLAVKGALDFQKLGVVKIENLLAMSIGHSRNRIIYPYFSEVPTLNADGARLGLWALARALPEYPLDEFRILDVIRGQSFAASDLTFKGDEEGDFIRRYQEINSIWEALLKEYQPA